MTTAAGTPVPTPMITTEAILARYREGLTLPGADSARRVWWAGVAEQVMAYGAMMKLAAQVGCPFGPGILVHDAGCGIGSMYPLVLAAGSDYLGSDFVPESVAAARHTFPDGDFRQLDLLRDVPPPADLVVACGTLSGYDADRALTMLEHLWASARRALVFTAWWSVPMGHHAWPEILGLRKAVTKFVHNHGARRAEDIEFVPMTSGFALAK